MGMTHSKKLPVAIMKNWQKLSEICTQVSNVSFLFIYSVEILVKQ